MSARHHSNRWIALVALFGLLFQQVAMATYRCPIEQAGAKPGLAHVLAAADESSAPCHAPESTDVTDPVRCEQHCHPTVASTDHAPPLTVPAALPLNPWTLPIVQRQLRVVPHPLRSTIEPHAGAPPLSVQYCSFQI